MKEKVARKGVAKFPSLAKAILSISSMPIYWKSTENFKMILFLAFLVYKAAHMSKVYDVIKLDMFVCIMFRYCIYRFR